MSQRQTYKGCTCGQCDVYKAPEQWCDGTVASLPDDEWNRHAMAFGTPRRRRKNPSVAWTYDPVKKRWNNTDPEISFVTPAEIDVAVSGIRPDRWLNDETWNIVVAEFTEAMTRLVNIHATDADYVSIMRPGPYGNPIILGETCPLCGVVHTRKHDGTAALVCSARHFYARLRDDHTFRLQVIELHGQTLGCVCTPAACHGDIFLAYLHRDHKTHTQGLRAIQQLADRWKLGQQSMRV